MTTHYRVMQNQNKVDKAVALCNPYATDLTTSPDMDKVTCEPCKAKSKRLTPLGRGKW